MMKNMKAYLFLHTHASYPSPLLGIKNPYFVGLRYEFGGKKITIKHKVWVWNEYNPYMIPRSLEPNDP